MAHHRLPSADELLAEILINYCGNLEHKCSQGETREVGIFRKNDIPFAFEIDWRLDKGIPNKFHIQIHHVRPRSERLVVDRCIEEIGV